jgi:hypothetical protein
MPMGDPWDGWSETRKQQYRDERLLGEIIKLLKEVLARLPPLATYDAPGTTATMTPALTTAGPTIPRPSLLG